MIYHALLYWVLRCLARLIFFGYSYCVTTVSGDMLAFQEHTVVSGLHLIDITLKKFLVVNDSNAY